MYAAVSEYAPITHDTIGNS